MTRLLEKAFNKAAQLPPVFQNALAKWLLEELKADKKWEIIFSESENLLEYLADNAIKADKKGKTKRLDIDSL